MTLYEANMEFEELIDAAINDLSPKHYSDFEYDAPTVIEAED